MGRFAQEFDTIAGQTRFTALELEQMFATPEERDCLVKVKQALESSTSENEQVAKVCALGDKALQVVVKLSRMALAV